MESLRGKAGHCRKVSDFKWMGQVPVDISPYRCRWERMPLTGGLATGSEACEQQGCALFADDRIVDGAGGEPADQLALRRVQAQRSGALEQTLSGVRMVPKTLLQPAQVRDVDNQT